MENVIENEVFETLVKFEYHSRNGDLYGLQIVSDKNLDILSEAKEKGVPVFLGEQLGKHSSVEVFIDDETCVVVTDDPTDIAKFREWFGGDYFGFAIMGYVREALEYDNENN
jgi:hypothetical protein